MKLYEVEFTVTAIIAANSGSEATIKAFRDWHEIRSETPEGDVCVDLVREVIEVSQLPEPWDGECFPYGTPAVDKRIKNYFEEKE